MLVPQFHTSFFHRDEAATIKVECNTNNVGVIDIDHLPTEAMMHSFLCLLRSVEMKPRYKFRISRFEKPRQSCPMGEVW